MPQSRKQLLEQRKQTERERREAPDATDWRQSKREIRGGAGDELAGRPRNDGERTRMIAELLRDGVKDDDADDDDADDDDADDDDGSERKRKQNTDDDGDGDGADDDDGSDDDESADGAGDESRGKRAPKTFDEIAETLSIEEKDLYGIQVPGTKRTLGELKDLAAEVDDLETRQHEFSERKILEENELLRAKADLDYVISRLPAGSLTKDVRDRAHAKREEMRGRERARTLDAIPEWRNDETREKESEAIGAWMEGYGFHAAEFDRVIDHRLLKLLRDAWQRHERVKKALAKVEESRKGKGVGKKPAKKGSGGSSSSSRASVDWRSPKAATVGTVTNFTRKQGRK